MSRKISNLPRSPVEQVMLQGEFIEAAEEDRRFTEGGGTLYWAIDTNIVDFLIDPGAKALPSSGEMQTGYAGIFGDDPKEPARILAHALAEYVLHELSPMAPLLIPPPIDAQVFRLHRRLVREGAESGDALANLVAASRAETLRKDLVLNDDAGRQADEAAAELLQLTLLRENTSKLTRLRLMYEKNQIANAAQAHQELSEPLQGALATNLKDGRHFVEALIEESLWREFLRQLAPDRRSELIEEKASAFALHMQWNRRLARQVRPETNGPRFRINFLSGDTPLFDAARLDDPPRNREMRRERVEYCCMHFRHPRGLLAELDLLKPASAAGYAEGGHFLDLWAHWEPEAQPDEQAELAAKIKENWAALLRKSVLRYPGGQNKTNELTDWQIDSREALDKWREARKHLIEEDINDFWEQCFYFATQGLVRFGEAAIQQPNKRNAPPLYFESWSRTASFVDLLLDCASPRDLDLSEYNSGIEQLNQEFGRKACRDAKYAYYIAHAVLFAARGNWSIAAKVAAFARAWTRADARRPGEANGREAIYLQASCRRHAARRPADLDDLPDLLKEVKCIAARERETAQQEGMPPPDCVEIRFDCEHLAIGITRWLFHRFSTEPDDPAVERNELATLARASLALLNKLEIRHSAAEAQSAGDAEEERRAHVLFRLRIRMLVNLFGLALYDRDRAFDQSLQRQLLIEAVEIEKLFNARYKPKQKRCFSDYGALVLACLKSLASVSERERREARKFALEMTDTSTRRSLETFPYDGGNDGRISWLRSIASE